MFYYPKWKSSKRRFFKFYGLRTDRNAAFTKFVIDTKAYFFTDIFYANIMHVLSKLIYWFYFLEYYSRKLFLVRAIFFCSHSNNRVFGIPDWTTFISL